MKDNVVYRIRNLLEDTLRDKKALIKILSIIVILLFALVLRIHESNKADIKIESANDDNVSEDDIGNSISVDDIYIDLGGEIQKPGVYKVKQNTRLYQVIEMAGGFTDDADTLSINQAAFVEDGEKVIIPSVLDQTDLSNGQTSQGISNNTTSSASPEGMININLASKDELKTLNGIGDVLADRIIDYRSSSRFKTPDDIKSVKGIGNALYEKIKDRIIC